MKRKFTAILLALVLAVLCIALHPVTAQAATVASGKCGDNLTWVLDDAGTMTISGTGAMWDFRNDSAVFDYHENPWGSLKQEIKKVVFQFGITYVGADAFYDCRNLTQVIFTDSITSIAPFAFLCCENLENFQLPQNLQGLGQQAFDSCKKITKVIIPDTVTFLDSQIFNECSALTDLYIGGKKDAGTYVHANSPIGCCYALEEIKVSPDNIALTAVDGVLYSKDGSTLVQYPAGKKDKTYTVPGSVKDIMQFSVDSVPYLEVIFLPKSLESIGVMAFRDNINLKEVHYAGTKAQWEKVFVDPNNETLQKATFYYNATILEGWVKEDGQWVFYEDGEKLCDGWAKDGSKWCYLGADGYMVTNQWVKDGSQWCYIDKYGYMVTNGWAKDGTVWRWMNKYGYITYSKWIHDGYGWCYINGKGAMEANKWAKDGSKWCYVGADGYMVTNKWVKDGSQWCYMNKNGYLVTNGWAKDGAVWRWMNASGYITYSKWVHDGTEWCYINGKGAMEVNKWVKDGKYWAYVGKDGYMVSNQWVGTSYVDANGHALTGTHTIGGKKYTFDANGNLIK